MQLVTYHFIVFFFQKTKILFDSSNIAFNTWKRARFPRRGFNQIIYDILVLVFVLKEWFSVLIVLF